MLAHTRVKLCSSIVAYFLSVTLVANCRLNATGTDCREGKKEALTNTRMTINNEKRWTVKTQFLFWQIIWLYDYPSYAISNNVVLAKTVCGRLVKFAQEAICSLHKSFSSTKFAYMHAVRIVTQL